jgi:hypothetical protein
VLKTRQLFINDWGHKPSKAGEAGVTKNPYGGWLLTCKKHTNPIEHILRNCLLALFDQPKATLADIPRLLDDNAFRRQAAARVSNEQVRTFWLKEYAGYPARLRAEAIAPLQNKVGAFLANPLIYRIVAQEKSSFRLRGLMDEGKILLVNLAKGKIGADTSTLGVLS